MIADKKTDKRMTTATPFVGPSVRSRLGAFASKRTAKIKRKGAEAQRRNELSQTDTSIPSSASSFLHPQSKRSVSSCAAKVCSRLAPRDESGAVNRRTIVPGSAFLSRSDRATSCGYAALGPSASIRGNSFPTSIRRGYSLIEMLATMVVAAAVLTVVTGWLVTLLRGESAGRDHLLYAQTQDRLARQFRQDVHAALKVTPPAADDAALLSLVLAGDTLVEYQIDGDQLNRLERRGDEVRRRESYRLPPPGRVRVELLDAAEPTLATLLIEQRTVEAMQPNGNTLRIDARCGLLQRLAARETRPE